MTYQPRSALVRDLTAYSAAVLELTHTLGVESTEACVPCQERAATRTAQTRRNPDNLEVATRPAEPLPRNTDGVVVEPPSSPASGSRVRWSGVIGVEGELTGDGRLIEHNALRWEGLPLKLRYVASDVGAHDGAVVVGNIDTIERREGGAIWAAGYFDTG